MVYFVLVTAAGELVRKPDTAQKLVCSSGGSSACVELLSSKFYRTKYILEVYIINVPLPTTIKLYN